MANIDPYIEQIQNAVYGEEVRTSIINALVKVNADNESYEELKETVVAAKDDVDEQVEAFKSMLTDAETAQSNLETAISNAGSAQSSLETATDAANTVIDTLNTVTETAVETIAEAESAQSNLETVIANASSVQETLETATESAVDARESLQMVINAAETAQSALEGSTEAAGAAQEALQTVIDSVAAIQSGLETVINSAETTQSNLQTVIDSAETAYDSLNALVTTSQEILTELTSQNETALSYIEQLESASFDAHEILTGVEDLKAYLGYLDEDIVGLQVDYANKTFQRLAGAYDLEAGEDFDQYTMYGGRKRCIVTDDGNIVAWYGDDAYTETGFLEEDVTDDEGNVVYEAGTAVQAMVYQPKFYYRVVPLTCEKQTDGEGYHLRKANYYVSTREKTGFSIHPAFIDADGNEVEYIMYSSYEGCIYDASEGVYDTDDSVTMDTSADMFSSIAGVKPASGLSNTLTRPNIETLAQNRGENWHGDLIKAESANQLLMMIELGMMNTQTAIENGIVSISDNSSYNCSSLTGSTSELGNGTGAASSTINEIGGEETEYSTAGKRAVSYRGMENPWGNIWKHVYGVNIHGDGTQKGGIPFVCSDYNFAESKMTDNYVSAGFTVTNASGYISAMGYSEDCDWLLMASECSGNSSLPVGDYIYVVTDLNGYRITLLGGNWNGGSYAGGFYWYLNYGVGGRNRYTGGRLVYVPKVTDDSYQASIDAWESQMT